jgi:poly(3-hydroxyalkanoate) synthetase
MKTSTDAVGDVLGTLATSADVHEKMMIAVLEQAKAAQTYWVGLCRSVSDFMAPSLLALNSLSEAEEENLEELPLQDLADEYQDFWETLLQMSERGLNSALKSMSDFHLRQMDEAFRAWTNTVFDREGEDLASFMTRQAKTLELLVHKFPQAIKEIKPEYGFHFDDGHYIKVAETERFCLYQVLPWHQDVKVRKSGKPIILLPAYVLGANIMAFLPGKDRSFVHCFANQGIPTYVRIVKDINTTPAVQTMTGEDDCRDTRSFCELLKERHGNKVTLCGYCQGGYIAVLNLLSGELDDSVDALITCASPMDGTRSPGLASYLGQFSPRFQDMKFAIKTLPNGNRVVDGRLMSWVFKLKNIENENPISAFYRDLKMLEKGQRLAKRAAAINYWMLYDVTDLPVAITQMSFESYTIPVAKDGTLPVQLFGRTLNFHRINEKRIPWLICCADKDELVEKETALAPLDWVKAEVALFPKGHVAMATSWALPTSECSLTSCFGDNCRGPVRYQLDLEAALAPPQPKALAVKPSIPAELVPRPLKLPGTAGKPSVPAKPVAQPRKPGAATAKRPKPKTSAGKVKPG